MKIALVGATGMAGSRIRDEAIKRGHHVTAIARRTHKLPQHERLKHMELDAEDISILAEKLKGHDVVILAVRYQTTDGKKILEAAKKAGVKRIAVVGGAGTLEVAPGQHLMHQDFFPMEYFAEATANADILEVLKSNNDFAWTYISPPAYFFDGDAIGNVRFDTDKLVMDAEGKSAVSTGDYAVVMMDEIENPKHLRERFTLGY